MARAIRQRSQAEEIEAIRLAEEGDILEDTSHLVDQPAAQQALRIARAARDTVAAAHQTASYRIQVAEQVLSRLRDDLEETNSWVREAEIQIGEILEVLASTEGGGLTQSDFQPILISSNHTNISDSTSSSGSDPVTLPSNDSTFHSSHVFVDGGPLRKLERSCSIGSNQASDDSGDSGYTDGWGTAGSDVDA